MKRRILVGIMGVFACGSCAGQLEPESLVFVFPNGNVYDGSEPVAVELWVSFDVSAKAFAGWKGQVTSTDPSGDWTGMNLGALSAAAPGLSGGESNGGNVTGIVLGQLHFPPVFFANTSNPIHIWSGEWSSDDLTGRLVELTSATTKFELYSPNYTIVPFEITLEGEASGEIVVVPGPGGAAVIALGGLVAARRRR